MIDLEILQACILVTWAVSNVFGPMLLIGSLEDSDFTVFLPIAIVKLLRKELNLAGTIIAMTFICVWFSLAVVANIIMIVLSFIVVFTGELFYKIFKRKNI